MRVYPQTRFTSLDGNKLNPGKYEEKAGIFLHVNFLEKRRTRNAVESVWEVNFKDHFVRTVFVSKAPLPQDMDGRFPSQLGAAPNLDRPEALTGLFPDLVA